MASGVRVSLQPKKVEHVAGFSVSGALVNLHLFGAAESKAVSGTDKPAKLVFSVSFYEDVRKQQQGSFEPLASVAGTITLDDSSGKPVFTLGAGAVLTLESELPADGLVRELELEFDSNSFEAPPAAPLRLKVPEEPEGSRFLELGVVLEIDGQPEAAQEVNDRLDVPLYQFVVLFLEYENGDPMADARFEVRFAGRAFNGSSDEAGKAVVQLPNLGRGTFRLKLLEFPEAFAE